MNSWQLIPALAMGDPPPGVVADGYHNGYGYNKLWLKTPQGTVYLTWDGGYYDVTVNPDGFPDELEHKPDVWDMFKEMTATGMTAADGWSLTLYEEDANKDMVDTLDGIFESVGLQAPWFLDVEDGTIRAQYSRRHATSIDSVS